MRTNIFLILFIAISNYAFAQGKVPSTKSTLSSNTTGKFYLNLSSGVNNPNGFLGLGVDATVAPKILVGIGAGLSTWGNKFNLKGMVFLKENHLGSAVGLSVNYSTGLDIAKNSNQTFEITTSSGSSQRIYGATNGATSVNMMYGRYWQLGKRSKFYINTGLVTKLNTSNVNMYDYNTDVPVTSSQAIRSIKIVSPGGLCFAAGFLVSLNK
jgi:hypothetical protein